MTNPPDAPTDAPTDAPAPAQEDLWDTPEALAHRGKGPQSDDVATRGTPPPPPA